MLGECGFHVVEALDGQRGLEMLAKHYYDLVLADVEMCGKDGYLMVKELRALEH